MAARKKTTKKRKETGFEMLARLIKEGVEDVRKEMATKDDIANMATKADVGSLYRRMATKDDIAQIRQDMATKVDLEETEGRIIAKLTPLEQAFDKDALTVIDHGVRIEALEKSGKR